MYTLYIANKNYSSWSLRPWVLMRELAIPFEERLVPFESGSNWEAFRKFSPSGKVPCLHDNGVVVWDSFAVAEYLAERHAGVWPVDSAARAWARSAAAEMHSGFAVLRQQCPMHCGFRIELKAPSPALRSDFDRLSELWEEGLRRFGGPFLAGRAFSAVDAFYAPVAFRVQTYGVALSDNATAYARRLLAFDSMRAWETAALAEPWREPGHEQDALAAGELLEDRRAKRI